jgi:aspartokinase-like uncharacterized kinase
MGRYFFDLFDGDCLTVDEDGTDVSSVAEVRRMGVETLAEIFREIGPLFADDVSHRLAIEARDATGQVLTVMLSFNIELSRTAPASP